MFERGGCFAWLLVGCVPREAHCPFRHVAERIHKAIFDCRHLAAEAARMFTARKKIVKEKGAEPDDFEESVAQVSISQ